MSATRRHVSAGRGTGTAATAALAASLVIGAYLMSLGHRSPSHAWVGWLSLVPLFLVIRLWRPGPAGLAGALLGVSLYAFRAGRPDAGIPATIPSLLLLAVVPAAYACLGAWLPRRIGFSPLVLGVGWMGVEFAFQAVGMRNGLLAAGESGIIHWVGSALGYVLGAFLAAFVSASLVCLLSAVRLVVPLGLRSVREDSGRRRLTPQRPACLPVLVTESLRPRAPPHLAWP